MTGRCGLIVGANYRAQAERSYTGQSPRDLADQFLEDPFVEDVFRRVAAASSPAPMQVIVAEEHGALFVFPVLLEATIVAVVG